MLLMILLQPDTFLGTSASISSLDDHDVAFGSLENSDDASFVHFSKKESNFEKPYSPFSQEGPKLFCLQFPGTENH